MLQKSQLRAFARRMSVFGAVALVLLRERDRSLYQTRW